eukprot:g628.t1
MSNYLRADQSSSQSLLVSSCLWYTLHYLIVCMGMAALVLRVPLVFSVAIIGTFVVSVNMIRLIINKGEIRFFRSVSSTTTSVLVTGLGQMIACVISSALIPASLLRYPNALGPAAFGFSWTVSFGLSIGFVFSCLNDANVHLFCGFLGLVYTGTVVVFFSSLSPKSWTTFFFATQNWKDTLRCELWFDVHAGSTVWDDLTLLGDNNAHFAGLIKLYLSSDLPWDKLKDWLVIEKEFLRRELPTWLSEEWLALIPSTIRRDIWTEDEFAELTDVIKEAELPSRKRNKTSSQSKTIINDRNKNMQNKQSNTMKKKDKDSNPKMQFKKAPTQAMVVAPKQTLDQQEDENDLRQRIHDNIKKRRSSVMESFREFFNSSRDTGENIDQIIHIPKMLQVLVGKADTMTQREMTEELLLLRKSDLLDNLLCPLREGSLREDNVIPTLVSAMYKQVISKKREEKEKNDISKLLVAAFFEIADEVSDIVMAILFSLNTENLGWAATLMFVFIGINRLVNCIVSYSFRLPYFHILESIIGLKAITDTYRMVHQGRNATSGKVLTSTLRGITIAIGLTCESLPQMILQISIVLFDLKTGGFDQGIVVAQLISILASCLSIGISFASICFDYAMRELHPSGGKWLPKKDSFRQTILFFCLIITNAVHLLLIAFGYSCLFVFADIVVSLSIVFGSLSVFTAMRYMINDVGWRGLGLWNTKSDVGSALTLVLTLPTYFLILNATPLMLARYQNVVGPLPFTYAVVSSIVIAMTSIFLFLEDSSIILLFSILFGAYVLTWLIFFSIMDEDLYSFLFSTVNWKQTLRGELWENSMHSSFLWGVDELVGDESANHAAHIKNYRTCDLPWDKIKAWLITKKASFLESPPIWMTVDWFDNLTPEVKKSVWKEAGELELLIEKVAQLSPEEVS